MKILDRVTTVIRRKHYSVRTERTYRHWIRAFICFHRSPEGWRHPAEMGAPEVEAFLTHLAVRRHVAAATQNVALNAIVFLYRQVLEIDLETTMIYTHVVAQATRGVLRVRSPLDDDA